ncbi:hypothetical protein HOLleu_03284 [Holothuria leucospilota]|uniref:Uncharacterized protein n=1 Tax=Holothuria leucospilota TaxID=206669 RepID=A0A9Q1CT98_HOLLE|nr:hypothetical protein HOLleu_03284 [Holothuria leucospilota]
MRVISPVIESNADIKTDENSSADKSLVGLFKAPSLPKRQVKQFDGDSLLYYTSISSFKRMVSDIPNESLKLRSGRALELIQYCVLKPSAKGFEAAVATLKERFGNSAVNVQAWIGTVISRPMVHPVKQKDYADDLCQSFEALTALGYVNELNNQGTLRLIVEKLPKFLQNRWQRGNYWLKMKGTVPSLEDVVKFVKASSIEVNDPVFGRVESAPNTVQKSKRSQVNVENVAHHDSLPHGGGVKCWVCQSDKHWPDQCKKLLDMPVKDRFDLVKVNHVCFFLSEGCWQKSPSTKLL